jgi:hypothetical protein
MTNLQRSAMITEICMAFEKWWQEEHPELAFAGITVCNLCGKRFAGPMTVVRKEVVQPEEALESLDG